MIGVMINRVRQAWERVPGLLRLAGILMAGSTAVLGAAGLGMGIGAAPYLVGVLHIGTMVVLFWLMVLMAKRRFGRSRRKRHVLRAPRWWLLGVLAGSGGTIALEVGPMIKLGPHEVVCEEESCVLEKEGIPVRYLTPEEVKGFDASMLLVFAAGWLFLNTVAVLTDQVMGLSARNLPSRHSGSTI